MSAELTRDEETTRGGEEASPRAGAAESPGPIKHQAAPAGGRVPCRTLPGLGMLRVRLALVIGIFLCFVLFLGFVLYSGSQKVAVYFHRSQLAYDSSDRYERLSEEAYRHFKQRMDLLLLDDTADDGSGVDLSRTRLFEAIGQLRESVMRETDTALDAEDRRQQDAEPGRVARLTAFLEAGMYRFDEVERLRREGKREAAMLMLSKFLEEEIDRKFEPLIDAAVDVKRKQAQIAGEKMAVLAGRLNRVALAAAAVAVLFGMTAGLFLFRGIKRPIEALMRGTDEIAAGNLAYRIGIDNRNEFGYLAGHFNRMAEDLEIRRNQLREAHAVLEHKVAERTLELNKLNRELQRMDQARREFFADISHELRTPITVIRGEAEVTLRGRDLDAEEYKEALQRILELAMQQGTMVNDLLFLARAEMANLQFAWEPVELSALVAGAAEDLEVLARESMISVGYEGPEAPLWIRGDPQRLRQLLFILGDNACRYSSPGTRIGIALRADATQAHLSVQDQGMGIPAADLEAVFERYFRSANARRSKEGTGLGLPMAKSIVKAHGAEIQVASAEGVGTTFTIEFPLIRRIEETGINPVPDTIR